MLTVDRLKELLTYDPETGRFTRVNSTGGRAAGSDAGATDAPGHRTITVDGRKYRAARLAFLYMTGEWPKGDADHINGIRDDDRWSNLRDATRTQNLANMRSKGASGIKGATWVTEKSKWKAQIRIDGKNKHLGYFDAPQDASAAYAAAAQAAHGEFARW